eukprot:CAMPEP_0194064104 /NCGR_PEP_ID=MMETSP0009_2-20130614/82156_1 /TAXON_ID=210454 /ORGANISM="Grammatophora oceanica, Strain CCMP 410" /LENGTH=45 /DNA_ID= /DNA_START= /DNA_END= /DNA_ORIENTATION=
MKCKATEKLESLSKGAKSDLLGVLLRVATASRKAIQQGAVVKRTA